MTASMTVYGQKVDLHLSLLAKKIYKLAQMACSFMFMLSLLYVLPKMIEFILVKNKTIACKKQDFCRTRALSTISGMQYGYSTRIDVV